MAKKNGDKYIAELRGYIQSAKTDLKTCNPSIAQHILYAESAKNHVQQREGSGRIVKEIQQIADIAHDFRTSCHCTRFIRLSEKGSLMVA